MTEASTSASAVQAADQRWRSGWRWLALAWLLVMAVVAAHQWRFWQQPAIDSNILALLPRDADDRVLADVTERIAEAGTRQMVVLLGAASADQARQAEAAFRASLAQQETQGLALPFAQADTAADWFAQARTFYAPYRDRLLTPAQRQQLQDTDPAHWSQQALAALYGPMGGSPRLTQWRQDPLGLWPHWWQARLMSSGLSVGEDGLLVKQGRHWSVLTFQTRDSAFRLDGERVIQNALDRAEQAARAVVPALRVVRAGVPLHAEAGAVQANREINTIGWGSLAAVLLLVWLAFRSLRPIALVAISLLVGCATALSVTVWVFGQVHLLTLIFGASLVGVAEDYGIHWFASRQGVPATRRWSLLRHLLPGLCLALATSVLAYVALGLAPFPGLRQMALFSVVGLTAAFLTVICLFPWWDGGQVRETGFSLAIGRSLERWPRVSGRGWLWWTGVAGVILLLVLGGLRVRGDDDLRSLQSSPPALMAQQREAGELLGLPSPAQFFLIRAADAQTLLQREERLTTRLRALVEQGRIGGYRAISDWLPSQQQQQRNAALTAQLERTVMAQVGQAVGESLSRPDFADAALSPSDWLAAPVSAPFRHQWLGSVGGQWTSVVLVEDLGRAGALEILHQQSLGLDGVRWVNRTADFSDLLRHYRHVMSGLLLAGIVLVYALLWWRYRGGAWRVMLPTLLAGGLTVALLGLLGQPMQLFNVLALLLLLGMGIDYGIFLTEHRGDARAWMAVCIGAASTWLSFGLLALSATPALRAFGLTLLLGIGLVWLISPLFRPPAEGSGFNSMSTCNEG